MVQLHLTRPSLSFSISDERLWHMAARTLTWSPGRRPLRTLFSRRHTVRLTRITPTRFASPTTTREAQPVINFSGVSCSTDGGTTFTRVTNASGQSPFANTFGDPVILYNKPTRLGLRSGWTRNGSCTLGGYKSTNPSDPNSWTHFCVHTNGSDDRESGWADNNPSSPFFGRMYVSWNDFSVGGGALQVTFSTDNGATWHAPVTVINTGFIRNVQITGERQATGPSTSRAWTKAVVASRTTTPIKFSGPPTAAIPGANTYTGTAFPGPGVQVCSDNSYFTCMFSDAVASGGTRVGVNPPL